MSAFRILLVDDEPRNLALLGASLRPLGHDLVSASGGAEALRLFDENPPDLVLLDYVMPGLDGLEVLKEIRTRHGTTRVPVVLITAHSDRDHRLRGLEAGADEFLEKPIDRAVLLARVNTLLDLKASHDALAASNKELEQRHRALELARIEQEELTGFIVHDLKNPLSMVCAGLEFAQGELQSQDSELARALSDSFQAAQRLSTMISDLLTISRMEAAEFTLHREAITVTKLLRTVTRSYLRRAEENGIALAQPVDLTLQISADPTLLQRVLENVLDNAFRYTPAHGRISVEARSRSGVEIWVSNDGPPIPIPDRQRIFAKFRRGHAENASRRNAGLGLYFCKRAVEAHGGAIEVIDNPDFATSFRISLPA
jgi:two-component system, sensor histidine kinase and response regulator